MKLTDEDKKHCESFLAPYIEKGCTVEHAECLMLYLWSLVTGRKETLEILYRDKLKGMSYKELFAIFPDTDLDFSMPMIAAQDPQVRKLADPDSDKEPPGQK